MCQPLDLVCGTLYRSNCAIETSPTDCFDDSWRDTFLGTMDIALCDVWYVAQKKTFTYSLWTLSSENVWIKITMDRICTIYTAELLWDLSNSVPLLWCYCRNYFPSNVSPIVTMNCVLMQRGSASMVNFTGAGPVSLSFSLIGFEWSPTVSTVRESTLHTSKIVTMLTDVISLKLLLCVVIL